MFTCGWFSSGRDQAAIDLLAAAHEYMEAGFIPGRIAYVFCDRAPGETPASDRFQAEVRARQLPLVTVASQELRRLIAVRDRGVEAARTAFDREVLRQLADYETKVAVLAGYMLIISPLLSRERLCLNLHPAVPGGPTGTWQQVMWQLMEEGAAEAGAMMHLATPELDRGPAVAYFRLPLTGADWEPRWQGYRQKRQKQDLKDIQRAEGENEPLFAKIRAEELRREFPLILLTLKNLAEGRLTLTPAGAEVNGVLAPRGFDISEQVEQFLAAHPRGW